MRSSCERLTTFKTIRNAVRGADEYLLVGIDVAKNRHHAFFGTPKGKTLWKNLVFDNSVIGFEALRGLARDLQNKYGLDKVVYGLEPTASYHKPLAEYLIRQGEPVVYVSNVAVAKNRALLTLITKRKIRIEQEQRLRGIWETTKNSAGCQVHDAAKFEAKSMVIQLRAARQAVKDVELQMKTVAERFAEYECLLSIPGFGPIVSAMVLAAIGDASRFEHRGQVIRLAGLDLSASRSGKTSDKAISKQGKAALRYALVQAAQVASSFNPTIRSYFSGLIKGRECERGIKMKMKVKLAAKMLVIAWTLMKRKEQFDPSCFTV
jgi:transposase